VLFGSSAAIAYRDRCVPAGKMNSQSQLGCGHITKTPPAGHGGPLWATVCRLPTQAENRSVQRKFPGHRPCRHARRKVSDAGVSALASAYRLARVEEARHTPGRSGGVSLERSQSSSPHMGRSWRGGVSGAHGREQDEQIIHIHGAIAIEVCGWVAGAPGSQQGEQVVDVSIAVTVHIALNRCR